jgi:hypothetical protein
MQNFVQEHFDNLIQFNADPDLQHNLMRIHLDPNPKSCLATGLGKIMFRQTQMANRRTGNRQSTVLF